MLALALPATSICRIDVADDVLGDVTAASSLFTVGQRINVVAPELAVDGVSTFAAWADGAPRIRPVTIGTQDQTLSVSYLSPIDHERLHIAANEAA